MIRLNWPSARVHRFPDAQASLDKLKSFPEIACAYAGIPTYLDAGFRDAQVRLAHELGNLTNRNVVNETQENLAANENSIMRIIDEIANRKDEGEALRIVSPYMFLARYFDKEGVVVQDDAQEILQWLDEHPERRIEIITNSVITSDNFMAQSIIDMDMAPRLLLTPEFTAAWSIASENNESLPAFVQSEQWKTLINNPQVFIYQTGRLDSSLLGNGDAEYGKLHAKYISGNVEGFVGTANFDYRSRLYNNEMGFFFESNALNNDLIDIFEWLKAASYRWGSPEWLEMRRQIMQLKGKKAWAARHQRGTFKFLRATGLEWLI